jgi:hypothetical protein
MFIFLGPIQNFTKGQNTVKQTLNSPVPVSNDMPLRADKQHTILPTANYLHVFDECGESLTSLLVILANTTHQSQ